MYSNAQQHIQGGISDDFYGPFTAVFTQLGFKQGDFKRTLASITLIAREG